MSLPRDLILARRAKRRGANYSLRIIREARRAGVPLSWAFALVDQESAHWLKGGNVFGCDKGAIFCHEKVTKARVAELLVHVAAGGVSNGVGLTQLTSLFLILRAVELGGAHIVKNQLRVGLAFFRDVTAGDYEHKAWHYNGSKAYQAEIATRQHEWHRVLTRSA